MDRGLIQLLEWDTKNFGYRVAKILAGKLSSRKLKDLLEVLTQKNIRLLYFYVDPKDRISNKAARENGGIFVDEKVTFTKVISRPTRVKSKKIQSYLNIPLNDQIRLLALEAGVYSRFRVDPGFRGKEFEKLYTQWIIKSLNGDMARDVIVYKIGKKEVGFLTLRDKNAKCNIGLIATDSKYRRRGIGEKLMKEAFRKAADWGYKEMDIVTQKANVTSCKFYRKMGFRLESVVNIYHFWL